MSNRRPRGRSGRRGRRASGQPRMPANQADQAQQQEQGQPEAPNPPANLNAVPPPGQPIVGGVGPNQQRPAFNPFNQQQIGVRQRMVGPPFGPQQPQRPFGPQQPQPPFGPQQPQPPFGPQQPQPPFGPQQPQRPFGPQQPQPPFGPQQPQPPFGPQQPQPPFGPQQPQPPFGPQQPQPPFGPQQPQPPFGPQQPQPPFGPQQPQPPFGPQQQQQHIAPPGPAQQQQQQGPNLHANLNAAAPPDQAVCQEVGPNHQRPAFKPVNQQQQRVAAPTRDGQALARQQKTEQPVAAPDSQQPALPQGAPAEAAHQQIVLFHKEVRGFYPRVGYMEIARSYKTLVYADRAIRYISRQRALYEDKFNLQCNIIVPALMYVQIDSNVVLPWGDTVPNYFVTDDQNREPNRSYRKQCGTHIYVDGTKRHESDQVPTDIQRMITRWYWNDQENIWQYGRWSKTRAPMSCLYPSVRPDTEGSADIKIYPEPLLGVLFCSEEKTGNDYYRRSYERRENNGRSLNVRDITENFIIIPKSDPPNTLPYYHYINNTLFPTNDNREAVAVYVCRGARVMLFDDSLYEWNKETNTLRDGKYELVKEKRND